MRFTVLGARVFPEGRANGRRCICVPGDDEGTLFITECYATVWFVWKYVWFSRFTGQASTYLLYGLDNVGNWGGGGFVNRGLGSYNTCGGDRICQQQMLSSA